MFKDLPGRGGAGPGARSGAPPPALCFSQHLGAEVAGCWEVGGCRVQTSLPRALPALPALGDRATRPSSQPLAVSPGAAAAAATAEMPPPGLELMSGRVLPAFLLCSTLLVIKMYVVAIITGQVRLRKKVRAALGDPSPACAPFSHRREGWGRDPWPRCFRGQSLSERARDQVPLPALWDGFSAALGFSGARTSFSSVLRAFTICCATR